ncbi:hypothetical protein F5Y09DRAFT_352267 [Xylaria sp. FL1042]|nr:hypothetical protein F5Y09DRAFT_352267 [Xylaria sp. FL1042]
MVVSEKPDFYLRNDGDQLQTFDTSQLTPAKSLGRPNQQRPAMIYTDQFRVVGDYDDKSTSKHKTYTNFNTQKPYHTESGAHGNSTSRPISAYSPYRPSSAVSSQQSCGHDIRASASSRESPGTYYRGSAGENDNKYGVRNNTTIPNTPRPTTEPPRRGAQPAPLKMSIPRKPVPIRRIDGVDFTTVSARAAPALSPQPIPIPIPIPTPAPAPSPSPAPILINSSSSSPSPNLSPSPSPSRPSSLLPTYSQSPPRSPSPAYGSWDSDKPRQKQPSFLKRAQAHIEHSIHEHMVKAGLRPLPSFNVVKVEKPISENVSSERGDGVRNPVVPKVGVAPPSSPGLKPRPTGIIPHVQNKPGRERWDLSSDSEAELQTQADMFRARQREKRVLKPLPPGPRLNPVSTTPNKNVPLRSGTEFGGGLVPDGLQTAKNHAHCSATGGGKPPALRSGEHLNVGGSVSLKSSNDSLFLGNGKIIPASESFFSSEYAQAQRDRAAKQHQQQQRPSSPHQGPSQALLSVSPKQEDKGEESESESAEVPLSRPPWEMLEFPVLPPPVDPLGHRLPLDDREDLPSRAMHSYTAQRRLTKKKGMHFRQEDYDLTR